MSMWLYIRKGYGSQHCLKMMPETSKKATNNKNKAFGAWLTNLSKAFFCWSSHLLIANFHANGLDLLSCANCSAIKVHFWTNISTYFTLLFCTFTSV